MEHLNYVGIDISARKLDVAISVNGKEPKLFQYDNDTGGIKKLIKMITKGGRNARVIMEATGIYGQPLALALDAADRCEVMVANPKQIRHFGQANMKRNKNDVSDAIIMVEFAKRMEFKPWNRPSDSALHLQTLARRICQMKCEIGREKTRLKAVKYQSVSDWIANDMTVNINHLDRRINMLQVKALEVINDSDELSWRYELMITITGVGPLSAISILGELMTLPDGLKPSQWVAHSGLDPREHESGSSVRRAKRISKTGNKYLRGALFMPALTAKRHDPHIRAYGAHLEARGKRKLQAVVAIMRKLLHCIWGIFRHKKPFDGSKFYRMPEGTP